MKLCAMSGNMGKIKGGRIPISRADPFEIPADECAKDAGITSLFDTAFISNWAKIIR